MRRGFLVIAVAVPACTLFTPFGTDLTSGEQGSGDAAVTPDAPDVATQLDGGNDADASPDATPCVSGSPVRGFRVFDPSPTPGYSCALENALDVDGKVAGIDRGAAEGTIDGSNVTGCLAVEFAHAIDQVVIRAQPTAKGCLTACSDNCGTGHEMTLFMGATPNALERVNVPFLFTSLMLTDFPVAVPNDTTRVIAVCRQAAGDSRDDIAVDAVTGRCL